MPPDSNRKAGDDKMNNLLKTITEHVRTVVLLGHVRPDGDCVGTCLGMYNYLTEQFPELSVELYLDSPSDKFSYLANFCRIKTEPEPDRRFELCITMDSSDTERLGVFLHYFATAEKTLCLDHHITNKGFAQENYIDAAASSSAEVLYTLLEENKISRAVAECIYTGIIHDTGVFKHSNTTAETMRIAGRMLTMGVEAGRIIDDSFYRKTYIQNHLLGKALLESCLSPDGTCIYSVISKNDLELCGGDKNDLDGIIDQLRITEGVECAVFLYETKQNEYKVSMRSNTFVNVSSIAVMFGGGGHVRAAGCTMTGSARQVMDTLLAHIEAQLKEHDGVTQACTTES